ncbi:MAG: translation initiation factor [Gammaproteobacteria bacterium]|nr:translation initiation factor [Gammaproteobacteria bacterium]
MRINEEIRVRDGKVRLIGAENEQLGVVNIREALAMAEAAGLDLVEISPQAEPPVCSIMDHSKFLYEQKKKKNQAKKKQIQTQLKEVKFTPATEEADYQVKLRNILRFIEHKDKVKISIRFRGREITHQEIGRKMLKRLQADLVEHAVIEQMPKLEGRQMIMMVSPKPVKK